MSNNQVSSPLPKPGKKCELFIVLTFLIFFPYQLFHTNAISYLRPATVYKFAMSVLFSSGKLNIDSFGNWAIPYEWCFLLGHFKGFT